jgi:hypothetical protein
MEDRVALKAALDKAQADLFEIRRAYNMGAEGIGYDDLIAAATALVQARRALERVLFGKPRCPNSRAAITSVAFAGR